jgi:hypothetical protein
VLLAKRPGTRQAYDLAGPQSAMERTSAIAGQEHNCAERLDRVKPLGRLTFGRSGGALASSSPPSSRVVTGQVAAVA